MLTASAIRLRKKKSSSGGVGGRKNLIVLMMISIKFFPACECVLPILRCLLTEVLFSRLTKIVLFQLYSPPQRLYNGVT